jgi:glycerol uptake facilitator-like aquaporin
MSLRTPLAEFVGTATLLCVVVGSAEMAGRLAPADPALALLCNTLATGAGLIAILTALGDTGCTLNPAATLLDVMERRVAPLVAAGHVVAQTMGAVVGVAAAHVMFDLPLVSVSTTPRAGPAMVVAEALATAGLLVIAGRTAAVAPARVPIVVAAWVIAGYWFTRSMCFANPAVTVARILSSTPAGIAPSSAPGFLLGEAVGVPCALLLLRMLAPATTTTTTTTTKTPATTKTTEDA